jgi:hypothetical protein
MNINGREWSKEAIQTLYLRLGDFTSLARRLGISPTKLKALLENEEVNSPPNYVKALANQDPLQLKNIILREGGLGQAATFLNVSTSFLRKTLSESGFDWQTPRPQPGLRRFDLINEYIKDSDKLRDLIIQAGGYPRAAKWLGISESYLRNHLDKLKIQHRHIPPDANDAAAAMEQFGSVELAAHHLGTSVTMFKKALENWRDLRDPLKTGNNSVATGRVGENYFFTLRKDYISGTSSLDNHSQPLYDFEDSQLGKVNVKSANPVRMKRKKGYSWSWGVDFGSEVDYFALVCLDRERNPNGLFMVPNKEANFPSELTWNCWTNGVCGFYFKSETDSPKITIPPEFRGGD